MRRMVNRKNVNSVVRSAALAAILLAGHGASAQITTWTGASPGSWSVAGNWNNGLPSGGGFTALVDAGNASNRVVTVDGNFTVGTLGITAGDQVQIGNNLTLNVNALLNNAGTLSINAAANASSLSSGGGSLLINGGGTIVLGGANAIIGNNGTITNANNTIVGQGNIAGNGMFFINQGTVNANVNGGNIFVDPVAAGMTNSGTMTSSNGGTLRFNGQFTGGMTNTGTISAQNGSVTQFENNFGVTGGTFTTSGTGVVRSENSVGFASISNLGNWTLGNNSTSSYSGDLFNSGSINFAAAANDVLMNFNSGTTNLTGSGTINMGSTGAGEAVIGNGNGRLVNVDNFIRGAGRLGNNNQRFTNGAGGIVQADVSGVRLLIDPVAEADAFVNNGIMRATNGGLLQITGVFGGGVNNTGGTLAASGAGSEVQFFTNIGVTGGTLTTSAGGVIRTAVSQNVGFDSIANTGHWILDNNSTTNISGNLFNSGSINLAAAANSVALNFNSGTTNLTGGGTINMSTTGAGAALIGNGNGRLVNVNNTIRGTGNLGNNNQRFTNGASGLVSADVAGAAIFNDPVSEADSFVNNGVMRATGGGILQFTGQFGGGVTNNGTISALTGSEVQMFGGNGITGGTINSSGTGVIRVNDGNSAAVASVSLAGNVVVGNNSTLNLSPSTITNSGSINVNAGTNTNSQMNVAGGATVTLNGGGVVNLTNGNAGGVAFIGGSGTLVNVNNTIRGAGNLAANNIAVVNNSLVSADVSGQALVVDPVSGGGTIDFTNNGTMQASNGGFLQLTGQFGGGFINTNGRIIANNGSTVQLIGSGGVSGGTFSTVGTGAIEVAAGNTGFIANNANLGLFNVQSNATLNGAGTLLNNGTISVNAAGASAFFNCNSGTLVMTGTGQVILTTSGAGTAFLTSSGNAMDFGPSITVRGQGNIAGNNGAIVNRGIINADVNGRAILVDPVATANGFVNNNLMTATNGGVLQFTGQFGGGVTNNGTISAGTASLVQLIGSVGISGGTFTTTGSGGVEVAAGNSGFIANNVNTGALNVQNNATLNGAGTLINNGSLNVNPSTADAFLQCNSGTWVITGTGTINLNTGTGLAKLGVNGNAIDIGPSQVVRGRGAIAGNNGAIINRGLIVATGGGEIFVDPVAVADGFRNLNTMRVETASQLRFNGQFGGGVNNAGAHIDVDPGGTLRTEGSHGLSGGTITLDGTFNADSSSNTDIVNFRGNGTLNISNSARVGLQSGAGSVGTSRVTSLSIINSGRLDLNDQDMAIDYTGASPTASLRPLIQAGFNGGPWNGNTTMITSTAANAAAAGADKTAIGYAEATEILGGAPTTFNGVAVDATSTLLRYTLSGDANLDFTVNITDFARLAANFNTPALWYNGDFNYDGTTNISDFALLAANFNKTLSADLPRGGSVPEPAAMGALLLLAGAMKRVRRC